MKKFFGYFKKRPKTSDECYVTFCISSAGKMLVRSNLTKEHAATMAELIYKLNAGMFSGAIVDYMELDSVGTDKEEAFIIFMEELALLIQLHGNPTINVMQEEGQDGEGPPIIMPSDVFRYTAEQPKL